MRLLISAVVMLVWVRLAPAAEREFTVRGVVAQSFADGQITVTHEEIPGYMPAMTMPFTVERAAQSEVMTFKPGDRVEFQFRVGETSSASAFRLIARAPAEASRVAPPPSAGRLREGDRLPEFSLTDETGAPITREQLRGKNTLVTFVFTRCPVPDFCPRMSGNFRTIQDQLRAATPSTTHPVQLLSISIDPAFDTPAVLRDYAARYEADRQVWRFATGTAEEIGALRKAFAVHAEPSAAVLDHTLATALIAPDLRVVEIWRGNRWKTSDVLKRIAQSNGGLASSKQTAQ